MDRIKTRKVVAPVEALEHPEEWSFFTHLELVKSRGSQFVLHVSTSLLGAINFICTVFNMRVPGLYMHRLPLFV